MLTKKDIRKYIVAYRSPRPSRQMRVKWSPESAQDLKSYHSVDAEADLTHAMAKAISEQIDAEFIKEYSSKA